MTGTATNPRARSRAHPRQYQPGAHRTGNAAALRRELEQIELGTPDIKRVVRLVTRGAGCPVTRGAAQLEAALRTAHCGNTK